MSAATTSKEAQTLLDKLRTISDTIEAHKATLYLLELERMSLRTELRLSGWTPPEASQGRLL